MGLKKKKKKMFTFESLKSAPNGKKQRFSNFRSNFYFKISK